MPTLLAYGDSNTWGMLPLTGVGRPRRLDPASRWPGVLGALVPGLTVIEAGLSGRTTCLDDPVDGAHLNGLTHLPVALASHAPLDIVVVMLGTNDLKHRFAMQPRDIAGGLRRLLRTIRDSECGPEGAAPKVLAVAPVPLGPMDILAETFEGGADKSHKLAAAMAPVAAETGAAFLDAASVVSITDGDGVHLDAGQHGTFARGIASMVKTLF